MLSSTQKSCCVVKSQRVCLKVGTKVGVLVELKSKVSCVGFASPDCLGHHITDRRYLGTVPLVLLLSSLPSLAKLSSLWYNSIPMIDQSLNIGLERL